MRVLAYWAARSALFVAVWAALWLVEVRGVLAVVAAFVVAWLLGYLLLPKMRLAAGAELDGWIGRFQERHHRDDAEEDAEASR
jgi:hypothetical protein